MKVAIYVRVSTDHQTTDNQLPDIQDYLKSHAIVESDVVYFAENESSWSAGHQTELAKLKKEIRDGIKKYDLFIVWAFDRLSRQGSIALIREWEFFASHGVKVISIKEPWSSDLSPEMVPFFLCMWGYIASQESKRKSERVKAGIARKMKEDPNWKPGRQLGAKDKPDKRRRRAGYLKRYLREPNKLSVEKEQNSELQNGVRVVAN